MNTRCEPGHRERPEIWENAQRPLFHLHSRETETSSLISAINCPLSAPTLCETLYHKIPARRDSYSSPVFVPKLAQGIPLQVEWAGRPPVCPPWVENECNGQDSSQDWTIVVIFTGENQQRRRRNPFSLPVGSTGFLKDQVFPSYHLLPFGKTIMWHNWDNPCTTGTRGNFL